MDVQVRPFSTEDAAACGAIVDATPLWRRYGLDGAALGRRLVESPDVVLVAEVGGRCAGFAWVMRRGAFGRSAYLRLIAVDPALRGVGVGVPLLRAFEAVAAEASPDAFLLVSDFNRDAQRFYRREGYVEIGRIDDYVVPGVSELLFRKRLTS
jgi:ribosomal protein S18 acetylase RimI-like enzyme